MHLLVVSSDAFFLLLRVHPFRESTRAVPGTKTLLSCMDRGCLLIESDPTEGNDVG